jgi:FkbM family methyltransferase
VVAFEPQPAVYQLAAANVRAVALNNVLLMKAALGHRRGSVTMENPHTIDRGRKMLSTDAASTQQPVNWGGRSLGRGSLSVPMITLDSLALHNVSFIKIDVQGSESLAIKGAQATILESHPVINMELEQLFIDRAKSAEFKSAAGVDGADAAAFDGAAWLLSIGYKVAERLGSDAFYVFDTTKVAAVQRMGRTAAMN